MVEQSLLLLLLHRDFGLQKLGLSFKSLLQSKSFLRHVNLVGLLSLAPCSDIPDLDIDPVLLNVNLHDLVLGLLLLMLDLQLPRPVLFLEVLDQGKDILLKVER